MSDVARTGQITLVVNASSVQSINAVGVFLNTDKNASTGGAGYDGSEYAVYYSVDADGWGWSVERWSGSDWQIVPRTSTMAFSRSGGTLTWTVGKADLGDTSGFSFYVAATAHDTAGNLTGRDFAPDDGDWVYDLSTAPAPTPTPTPTPAPAPAPAPSVKPVIGPPSTVPASVAAGKRLSVSFPVTRSDDAKPLTSGRLICDPSVAGKVIRHAEQFKNGSATLTFTVPATAKGKLLKVKVTIKLGNQSATRVATFRVR